jgi:excisionase family DNA binding protein
VDGGTEIQTTPVLRSGVTLPAVVRRWSRIKGSNPPRVKRISAKLELCLLKVETMNSAPLRKGQLIERLSISEGTLRTWLKHRKIPYVRIGGIVRFDWERVKQALETFEVKEVKE